MGRRDPLYEFYLENNHLCRKSFLIKARQKFPNKASKEVIAKLNCWDFFINTNK